MNQAARIWTLLGITLALFLVLLSLFDWMFFLIVPLPLTIPLALGASFLVRRQIASTTPKARGPVRLVSYVSTVGCLVASAVCWGVWVYSWKYGEAGAPAGVERTIDLSFAASIICLAASVWCSALMLLMKPAAGSERAHHLAQAD